MSPTATRRKRGTRNEPGSVRRGDHGTAEQSSPVLLVGARRRATRVRDTIRRLGLGCRVETDPKLALERMRMGREVRLVVLVPPIPHLSAEDFCRRFRKLSDTSRVPILVVGASSRDSGRLYRAGATYQFEWPKERAALVRTVLRLVGSGMDQRSCNARDVAIATRVEERLRTERDTFGPLVRVRVQRGVVFLGGEVDSAWKIAELGRLVSSMSGVDEVVTSGIRIPVSGIPDRVVSKSVRDVLKASGVGDQTLGFRVSNGRVIVTGAARNRRELERIVGLIEQIAGVRGVENLVVVSRRQRTRDKALAAELRSLIARQFPRSEVSVAVLRKVAVLSGIARDAQERRSIESLVTNHVEVERVVSKVR